MNFKSYLIEKNYSQISKIKSILFYGENIGLKKHFKKLIKTYNKDVKIITFLIVFSILIISFINFFSFLLTNLIKI